MIYEIKRNGLTNLVYVRFAGDVPVEVREALIKNGFSWQEYDKSWTSLDIHEDWAIRAIINVGLENVKERPVMSKAEEKALRDEYMARIMADEDERWRKYYEGEIGAIVKLTNGWLVNIEKPRIETDFCFGESGYDEDDAIRMAEIARTRESYFLQENLKNLKSEIQLLSRDPDAETFYDYPYSVKSNKIGIACYYSGSLWDRWGDKCHDELSEEDRERMLEGYRKVYAAFEKRLKTYLKRYGLSKVHSWTYWRDA